MFVSFVDKTLQTPLSRGTADFGSARTARRPSRRLRHEFVGIFLEQETVRHGLRSGILNLRHIGVMGAVAFFQRETRIAGCHPLRFGLRKRNEAAVKTTDLALRESCRGYIPASVCTQRNLTQHRRNAAHIVTIGIRFRHQRRQSLTNRRRRGGDRAGQIVVLEIGAEIVVVQQIQHAIRRRLPGYRGESHGSARRRHQFALA